MKIIPMPENVAFSSKKVKEQKRDYLIDTSLSVEEYLLKIDEFGVVKICYSSDAGKFYAEQTLRQITYENGLFPVCSIKDKPEYSYRGVLLDCARHMFTLDEIKKLIDAMALLKFNKLHWHLTDDQGWRIESKIYPELNSVSAVRQYSDFGKTRIDEPYGRVYTQKELSEIVDYCRERFIEVVPEFDIPGHTSALLAAFPQLSCSGLKVRVKTHQGIFRDVLCPGKEESIEIVNNIFDEICDIFPGKYIHIGGDEAPSKHWETCPDCKAKMEELSVTDYKEYQNSFMNAVIEHLDKKGKTCIVWNDAAKGKNLSKKAIVQYWKENDKATVEFANGGGRLILSPFTYYYTDYDYNITPLNRTYSFSPMIKGLNSKDSICGLEVPIWTEYISDNDRLETMLFPRAAAVAEAAWSGKKRSYPAFLDSLKHTIGILNSMGIKSAPEKVWTKSRAKTVKGWLSFVKDNYSLSYIKEAVSGNNE